ncbi:integrase catalytic domain-containing protein [Nephila pilipes]|uniref:Integrase catalytic domain-containing protein n=1 Tax=Nephila pilipes TaxID=299642 RepID=A0A8X6Q252_NEPPI|nr:integrase catalytic domain-containing protein [Nephila pilipes]
MPKGVVEGKNRQLITRIKNYATSSWLDVSSTILLGLHSCLTENIGTSPANYPKSFLEILLPTTKHHLKKPSWLDYVRELLARKLHLVSASQHSSNDIFVHPELQTTTHLFVSRDTVRKTQEQTFKGPFKVLSRKSKLLIIYINGYATIVFLDSLKPAYVFTASVLEMFLVPVRKTTRLRHFQEIPISSLPNKADAYICCVSSGVLIPPSELERGGGYLRQGEVSDLLPRKLGKLILIFVI